MTTVESSGNGRGFEIAAGDAQRAGQVAEFFAGQFHGQSVRGLRELQFAVVAEQFDFLDFVLRRRPPVLASDLMTILPSSGQPSAMA